MMMMSEERERSEGCKMKAEIMSMYGAQLADLKMNGKRKSVLLALTMLAEDYIKHASVVTQLITDRIANVKVKALDKLITLYLVDSIVKTVKKDYLQLFTPHAALAFVTVFDTVNVRWRRRLFRLRGEWGSIFPQRELYIIDVFCVEIDPKWKVRALPPATGTVYFNPKFLLNKLRQGMLNTTKLDQQVSCIVPPASAAAVVVAPVEEERSENTEEMRAKLLNKQKELLSLQTQRVALEMEQLNKELEARRIARLEKEEAEKQNENKVVVKTEKSPLKVAESSKTPAEETTVSEQQSNPLPSSSVKQEVVTSAKSDICSGEVEPPMKKPKREPGLLPTPPSCSRSFGNQQIERGPVILNRPRSFPPSPPWNPPPIRPVMPTPGTCGRPWNPFDYPPPNNPFYLDADDRWGQGRGFSIGGGNMQRPDIGIGFPIRAPGSPGWAPAPFMMEPNRSSPNPFLNPFENPWRPVNQGQPTSIVPIQNPWIGNPSQFQGRSNASMEIRARYMGPWIGNQGQPRARSMSPNHNPWIGNENGIRARSMSPRDGNKMVISSCLHGCRPPVFKREAQVPEDDKLTLAGLINNRVNNGSSLPKPEAKTTATPQIKNAEQQPTQGKSNEKGIIQEKSHSSGWGDVQAEAKKVKDEDPSKVALSSASSLDVSLTDDWKERRDAVIAQIYTGSKCADCGTRFPLDQPSLHSDHMDWHFRQNRQKKVNAQKMFSRSWSCFRTDWVKIDEVEDLEAQASENAFKFQNGEKLRDDPEESSTPPEPISNPDHFTVLASSQTAAVCPQCCEGFESYFDDEREEWRYKNAMWNYDGEMKLYHPLCYQDHLRSVEKASGIGKNCSGGVDEEEAKHDDPYDPEEELNMYG